MFKKKSSVFQIKEKFSTKEKSLEKHSNHGFISHDG